MEAGKTATWDTIKTSFDGFEGLTIRYRNLPSIWFSVSVVVSSSPRLRPSPPSTTARR